MTHLIGFTGRKRSGKDTAALALINQGYRRVAFATPLKAMIRSLLEVQGCTPDVIDFWIEGAGKEQACELLNGRSPRHAMQTIGTEWGRELIDTNLWVDAAIRAADRYDRVVITDVRFPNEVEAVRAAGGIVIRVCRGEDLIQDSHPSEALIDDLEVDHEIQNDRTVADLHARVMAIVGARAEKPVCNWCGIAPGHAFGCPNAAA